LDQAEGRRTADFHHSPLGKSVLVWLPPDRGLQRHVGCVFAGIGIWFAIYPFIADWLERRAARKALADMRARSKQKHPWDALRGEWMAKRWKACRAVSERLLRYSLAPSSTH
jgi:hypothetical protein